ncbi:MAG: hypothetical protein ACRDZR_01185 [Acidimicrobiales bacterium]
MSAAADYEAAQLATAQALQALAELEARVDAGDADVTGAQLADAQAEVTIAARREAAAGARAIEEAEAARAAQERAAAEKSDADFRTTAPALTEAIATALESLTAAVTAAETHAATWSRNTSAHRNLGGTPPRREVPTTPDVLDGLALLAKAAVGQKHGVPYPRAALQPILPYLPASCEVPA